MPKQEKLTVRPRGRPPSSETKTPISFRIYPGLLENLQRIAEERGLPYQTLMHETLSEEISAIVNFERSSERQKVALMIYQLSQIVDRMQRECPNFALQAQELEDFMEALRDDLSSDQDGPAETVSQAS